ncbi:MAG: MlaD family protein, partial [Parahaliea sp.]
KGLSVGAPVSLRGVEVGQVVDINLILDNGGASPITTVEADILSSNIQVQTGEGSFEEITDKLIKRGMRAQLNTQSLLTGLLYVALDFYPDTTPDLVELDSPHIQIPSIPTELQKLSRQIEDLDFTRLASDITDIATGLKMVITDARFQSLPGDIQATFQSMAGLGQDLRTALARAEPRLDTVLDNANTTLDTINGELPRLSASLERSLAGLERAITSFNGAMSGIEQLVSSDSPTVYEVNRALDELAEAGRALQLLAKTLEEQPEALLRGKSEDKP